MLTQDTHIQAFIYVRCWRYDTVKLVVVLQGSLSAVSVSEQLVRNAKQWSIKILSTASQFVHSNYKSVDVIYRL